MKTKLSRNNLKHFFTSGIAQTDLNGNKIPKKETNLCNSFPIITYLNFIVMVWSVFFLKCIYLVNF